MPNRMYVKYIFRIAVTKNLYESLRLRAKIYINAFVIACATSSGFYIILYYIILKKQCYVLIA